MRRLFPMVLLFALGLSAGFASDSIILLPSKVALNGPFARQQMLIERSSDNLFAGQLTNNLALQSSDPKIARIEGATVIPVTNGTVTLTAKSGGQTATAQVTVTGMEKPFDWSFRNHVQPVLAKMGCSAGACHGAAAGQNGFKLSLRGYDDEGDYLTLTRQALGRRIVPSDPGRSLMLLKPTGAVPHKGGKKFEVDSVEYRILSDWIASGAPGPKPEDPRIDKIELLPEHAVLAANTNQQ